MLIKHRWRNIDKKTSGEILIKDKWWNIDKGQVAQY
jgi:hypothetical protein